MLFKRTSTVQAFALAALLASLSTGESRAADQTLIDAAKKEQSVTWYTTLIVNQLARPIAEAFQKKYGITVNYIRADTGDMLLRLQNETNAHKPQADLIDTTSGTPLLKRMGILEKWVPERAKELPSQYVDPNGYWVAASLYVLTPGFNTDLVKKGTEPHSLQDLLDPRWKGKLAVSDSGSAPGIGGFVGLVLDTMGEDAGRAYLKALAGQRLAVLQGSTRQVLDQVIAGEYEINIQTLNHHAAYSAARGAPVGWSKVDPAMAAVLAFGALKGPHPNAARLLIDYILSDEGQAIFRDADYIPVAPNIAPKEADLRPDSVNFKARYYTPENLDENIKLWMQVYQDILR